MHDFETHERLSDFFAWIEAYPELSRRENDELTRRIARLVVEEHEHPHLWFLVAVFRTVGDAGFVEDALMSDPATWPTRDDNSRFSASFMCGRIRRDFDYPPTAANAYRSCFVLCHLWGERGFIEFSHREDGDWRALLGYAGWGDDIAPDVLADLGSPIKLRVSRSTQSALNRVLGRPMNATWTRSAAAAAIDRLAASAPPHLGLDAEGIDFALRRYEERHGWVALEDGEAE